MNRVKVERFHDPRYSRPRYRLRNKTGVSGSYKLKRDAKLRADEINLGYFAAHAKRDGRYQYTGEAYSEYPAIPLGYRVVVRFLGSRVGTAATVEGAYQLAGDHLADRLSVSRDNPNRCAALESLHHDAN